MKDWLNFEYSNKEVTAHGGMSLLKRFFDKTGLIDFISTLGLAESGSNAGYSNREIFVSFFLSIWLGANRFAHTSILQHDKVLQKIFGLKRAPSNDTYRRFFQKFDFETGSNFFLNYFHGFSRSLSLITLPWMLIPRFGPAMANRKEPSGATILKSEVEHLTIPSLLLWQR
jgi:hypothetical protein